MIKSASPAAPLAAGMTGIVRRVGSVPSILPTERNATGADLRVTLSGGTAGKRAQATLRLALNTAVGARETARLVDETARTPPILAKRSNNTYSFGPIVFEEPGPNQQRRIRITNIRANASTIAGSGGPGSVPVTARLSISTRGAVPLDHPDQVVAAVSTARPVVG